MLFLQEKTCHMGLGVKMSIRFSSSHLILFVCLFVFETNILFVLFVFLKKVGLF